MGPFISEECILHGQVECTRCMSPDELYRWKVQRYQVPMFSLVGYRQGG